MLLLQGEAAQFVQRALVVSVRGATNADVDPVHSTTLVSEAPAASLELTFQSSINQVSPSATSWAEKLSALSHAWS